MERKLITDGFYINFVLTKKFKGVDIDGSFSASIVFEKCGNRNEEGNEIFFFTNGEEYLKITFIGREEINIFMNFENSCLFYTAKHEENSFNKIKKFISEVVSEVNENDGN